jgi:hypothetical protein
LDTVVHGVTGSLTPDSSPSALAQGILHCQELTRDDCRRNAARFSLDRFQAEISAWAVEHSHAHE